MRWRSALAGRLESGLAKSAAKRQNQKAKSRKNIHEGIANYNRMIEVYKLSITILRSIFTLN